MLFSNLKNVDTDLYLYNTGEAQQAYELFGCHYDPQTGMHRFCVFAKNAQAVSVVGDFNNWDESKNPMRYYKCGVFITYVAGLEDGMNYKYSILGYDGVRRMKADPFAFHAEVPPRTASKVWSLAGYTWQDGEYMERRCRKDVLNSPISIYEMHLGSWRSKKDYAYPNVRELADEVAAYCKEMGYTHVELMPVMEHPYDGSWGYQITGFYAVTARYGTPQDYMSFVDTLHQAGIGVILDWVPAHFPKDAHGLARFDGTCLYEHENPLRGEHPQWGTLVFNYESPEVVSFLISNAVFYFEKYHIDGLRVDAVTSMLYLDYARDNGQYVRNSEGGNIDFSAVCFLQKLNSVILTRYAGAMMIAEESTDYPMVTKPPCVGGLGFTFKWNMGFMHDTLAYMSMDPLFRRDHHDKMTFSMYYAFSENFILPYSHDEVVHGKASMVDKMFGDYELKFASLRALFSWMYIHPGKKLLFMGNDFAQFIEWAYKRELDWFLLQYDSHRGMQHYVRALNHLYLQHDALWKQDHSWEGFSWLSVDDRANSVVAAMRKGTDCVICAVNFTPVLRSEYRLPMPADGTLKLLLNSDDKQFYGKDTEVPEEIRVDQEQDSAYSCTLVLPPMSAVFYEYIEHRGN